ETLAGIRHARELLRTTDLRSRIARYHGDRTDEVITRWIETWLSPEFLVWSIEHFLAGITVPVLVLQGVRDEFGSAVQVEAIANGVSGVSESRLVAGAAHNPHKEATDETLRTTVDFLRRNGLIA
ncbi:MAG: alpha/beta hydrolase, partial [Gemmatimonadaceae bacterium]